MRDTHEKLSRAEAAAFRAIQAALADLDAEQAERVLARVQEQLDEEAGMPMFARGIAGPLGKLDFQLKTKVDEATAEQFRRDCVLKGTDTSAELRDAIYVLTWKRSYRQMVAEKLMHDDQSASRLQSLIGPFGAPEFGGPAR
ncbi:MULTISPECIES: hypothetical protein [unclassified Delftia]|uniref:hypothetical protein n=1 Tax=unclassified Delftia TaxID=2613839 RepID=UPI0018FF563F|nr:MULTISPECIES: hypothetical protein [unclassified Delftia]MBK0115616.1 hypothetical protein [Delftia sp. S65]MBK0119527.1 hypothetical protein [Delftia sp. S67]MBK0130169.1 hypothetical protein [Delftia sp. S66]